MFYKQHYNSRNAHSHEGFYFIFSLFVRSLSSSHLPVQQNTSADVQMSHNSTPNVQRSKI